MDFSELIGVRRSIRAFTDEPVSETDVTAILEAARIAPTAGNLQAFRIVVVREPGTKDRLARAAREKPCVYQAPVVLGFIADRSRSEERYGERGRDLYALQDATIATTFAMLAVCDRRLACVWVGAFDTDAVAEVLGCSEGEVPAALLPVGHAAEDPAAKPRRSLEDLVTWM
jgi:nitroreductase